MSEVKKLDVPPALYDYLLFYECAIKDWTNYNLKLKIKGDGSLMNAIKWNIDYSYDPYDAGGNTKFGVTEKTWQSFAKKFPNKYSLDLNSMNRQSWLDFVHWWWNSHSYAGECANYACAFMLFQMVWGGFSATKALLSTLKEKADKKDYPFINKGSVYKQIADATHAFTNPMEAFIIIRTAKFTHLYNISTPNRTNSRYRHGWFNRNAMSFTLHGFYACTTMGDKIGWTYNTPVEQWDDIVTRHIQNGGKGMIKIFDWGTDPESIEKLAGSGTYDFSSFSNLYDSTSSSSYSSGSYGGCGGAFQLGNYSNASDTQIIFRQTQNKEEVLQTLMSGSYTPDVVKKCDELIEVEKKKNVKVKSES